MNKKKLSSILAGVMLSTTLVACGKPKEKPENKEANTEKTETVDAKVESEQPEVEEKEAEKPEADESVEGTEAEMPEADAEVKEHLQKAIEHEQDFRETEEFKNADETAITEYENALAAAKSVVDDEKTTPEELHNALNALVEAESNIGPKAE